MCNCISVLPLLGYIYLCFHCWKQKVVKLCTTETRKKCVLHVLLFLFPFAMEVIEKDSKNRWMGFTHHNRNLSFKQRGEGSGFPGKTYRPLSTTFGGRLSSTATCWAVPWLHVFVCSMGGPSGIQTHNHSLTLQIKKCIYTLLSRETTSNQFRNIRRVECTEGLTEGHLGFLQIWVWLHLSLWL